MYTWGLDDGGRLGLEDMWEQEGKDTEAAGRARCVLPPRPLLHPAGAPSLALSPPLRRCHRHSVAHAMRCLTRRRIRNPEAPCLVRAFLNEAIFPGGVSIKQVSCGADHTLCVDEDGRVYAFGSGRNGQLGLSGTADVGVPHRVEGALAGEYVKQVRSALHVGHQQSCCRATDWGACVAGVCRHEALPCRHGSRGSVCMGRRGWPQAGHRRYAGERTAQPAPPAPACLLTFSCADTAGAHARGATGRRIHHAGACAVAGAPAAS